MTSHARSGSSNCFETTLLGKHVEGWAGLADLEKEEEEAAQVAAEQVEAGAEVDSEERGEELQVRTAGMERVVAVEAAALVGSSTVHGRLKRFPCLLQHRHTSSDLLVLHPRTHSSRRAHTVVSLDNCLPTGT